MQGSHNPEPLRLVLPRLVLRQRKLRHWKVCERQGTHSIFPVFGNLGKDCGKDGTLRITIWQTASTALRAVVPMLLAVAIGFLGGARAYARAQTQTEAQTQTQTQTQDQPDAPVAAPPSPPAQSIRASYEGRIVRELSLRGTQVPLSQIGQGLGLKVGEPLDAGKVHQAVAALNASGRFATIQVEAEVNGADGVNVTFVVEPNYFIGEVHVADPAPRRPTSVQILNVSKLELGEPYSEGKLDRAQKRIRTTLTEEGFLHPELSVGKDFDPKTQQVKLAFQVTTGPSARVGKLEIQGEAASDREAIEDAAGVHPGDEVTAQLLTKALKRLRRYYQKRSYLMAQVSIVQREPHRERNTVDFTFHIVPGPKVSIAVEGYKVTNSQIKELIPIFEENSVDDDLINEGARNLRDFLQTHGYFDAKVTPPASVDDKSGSLRLVYTVERGDRHRVEQVEILGNQYFEDKLLRDRLLVQAAGGVISSQKLSQGLYSQSLMARDKATIEGLYISNGFANVRVTTSVHDNFGGEGGDLGVTYQIEEGQQTRVVSLKFEGNQSVSTEDLRTVIGDAEGQPFSQVNVEGDRDAVLNAYFERGFSSVVFESSVAPVAEDPTRVQLIYRLTEGRQSEIRDVYVTGLNYTRPFVVQRELKLERGGPLNQLNLLDAQRRLYDLGLFSEVNVAIQNPAGDERQKNIVIGLTEAKRWTFSYGLGLEFETGQPSGSSTNGNTGVSPRVSLDVTRTNLFGREQTLLFRSRLGRLQQRGLISWDAPHLLRRPALRLTTTLLYDNTLDVNTFTSERLEASVQAEQALNPSTTMLYRYTYRRVRAKDFATAFDPETAPLLSQPVRVGLPSFTYIRDHRDNPIDTKRGNYTTVDLGLAAGFFGSEADFSRVLLQNSTYHRIHKRFVLARSTRVGLENIFGNTAFIPLPERFYAGGSTTHRGFGFNQAGPRDSVSGLPVGGAALFLNSFELRLPPWQLGVLGNDISFVLFHDSGNVFDSANHLLGGITRFKQDKSGCGAISGDCNLNYLSQSVGTGLRYKTPIGPVSVDFGYNINPPVYPVRSPTNPYVKTGRHYNIFFSIGQTF